MRKEFYFIATAGENNAASLERTFEGLRGFTDCRLEGAKEMEVICGAGLWQKGDVQGTALMRQAYEMGKKV